MNAEADRKALHQLMQVEDEFDPLESGSWWLELGSGLYETLLHGELDLLALFLGVRPPLFLRFKQVRIPISTQPHLDTNLLDITVWLRVHSWTRIYWTLRCGCVYIPGHEFTGHYGVVACTFLDTNLLTNNARTAS